MKALPYIATVFTLNILQFIKMRVGQWITPSYNICTSAAKFQYVRTESTEIVCTRKGLTFSFVTMFNTHKREIAMKLHTTTGHKVAMPVFFELPGHWSKGTEKMVRDLWDEIARLSNELAVERYTGSTLAAIAIKDQLKAARSMYDVFYELATR